MPMTLEQVAYANEWLQYEIQSIYIDMQRQLNDRDALADARSYLQFTN